MTPVLQRPPRLLGVVSTALAAGVLLSACGSDPGGSTPQATVEAFFHAIGDKDPKAACAVVSTGGKPLEGTPLDQCRLGFEKVLASLDDQNDIAALKQARVTGAEVDGDRATVSKAQITQVPEGFQNDIDLVRLGGRWYIDSKDDPTDTSTDTPTG